MKTRLVLGCILAFVSILRPISSVSAVSPPPAPMCWAFDYSEVAHIYVSNNPACCGEKAGSTVTCGATGGLSCMYTIETFTWPPPQTDDYNFSGDCFGPYVAVEKVGGSLFVYCDHNTTLDSHTHSP
jgi:hypothetical protein